MSIVDNISRIVSEKGLLKSGVASRAGFTQNQFSDLLNGRKRLLANDMPRIADALGVQISELYDCSDQSA